MKILLVSIHPEPIKAYGESLKTACILDSLRSTGCAVDVICKSNESQEKHANKKRQDPQDYQGITQYWRPSRRAKLPLLSLREFKTTSLLRHSSIEHLVDFYICKNPYCVVIWDDITLVPLAAKYRERSIVSLNDCASEMFLQQARLSSGLTKIQSILRWLVARRYERNYLSMFRAVTVLVERDKLSLVCSQGLTQVKVIPNYSVSNPLPEWHPSGRDFVIWADLRTPFSISGTEKLLMELADRTSNVSIVGRLEMSVAKRLLRSEAKYFKSWEDALESGTQPAAIVIPDIAGTGMKNRLINAMERGYRVFAMREQFAGLESQLPLHPKIKEWSEFAQLAIAELQEPEDVRVRRSREIKTGYANNISVETIGSRWKILVEHIA